MNQCILFEKGLQYKLMMKVVKSSEGIIMMGAIIFTNEHKTCKVLVEKTFRISTKIMHKTRLKEK